MPEGYGTMFQVLRERNYQTRNLHSVKIPFRNEDKIKTCLVKQNQRICHQEALKRLLQVGRKEGFQMQLGYTPKYEIH